MKEKLQPNVSVIIAGQSHQLRWDKAALFDLGAFPDAAEELDTSNGAKLFRSACIFCWCAMVDKGKYKSPRDVAAVVAESEMEKLMEGVNEAIQRATGGMDGTDDPLSKSGHSPAAGSD